MKKTNEESKLEIVKKTQLTTKEQRDIYQLIQYCDLTDGTLNVPYLSHEYNHYQEMNTVFMDYKDNQLIGCISVYADDPEEAEMVGFVLPKERRQGVFTRLLQEMKKELRAFHYSTLLAKVNQGFVDYQDVLGRYQGKETLSEYFMVCPVDEKHTFSTTIEVEKVQTSELVTVGKISAAAFEDSFEWSYKYIEETFHTADMHVLCLKKEGEIIGSVNVDNSGKYAHIFGLCIAPCFQGKGYGTQSLQAIIQYRNTKVKKPLSLEVESTNEQAYRLYQRAGFQIGAVYVYYDMWWEEKSHT